jgi:hypothetical protein
VGVGQVTSPEFQDDLRASRAETGAWPVEEEANHE